MASSSSSSSSSIVRPLAAFLLLSVFVMVSQADLQGDVNVAISAVTNCLNVVKRSGGSKEPVSTCVEVLGDAIDYLKDTVAAARAGKIDDAKTKASAALTDVTTCEDEYEDAPPQVKSALSAAGKTISTVLRDIK